MVRDISVQLDNYQMIIKHTNIMQIFVPWNNFFNGSAMTLSRLFFCNIATFANMQAPSCHGESVRYTGWQRKLTTKLVKVNFPVTLAATGTKFKRRVTLGVWLPRCLGLFFGTQSREAKWRLQRFIVDKTRILKLPRYWHEQVAKTSKWLKTTVN